MNTRIRTLLSFAVALMMLTLPMAAYPYQDEDVSAAGSENTGSFGLSDLLDIDIGDIIDMISGDGGFDISDYISSPILKQIIAFIMPDDNPDDEGERTEWDRKFSGTEVIGPGQYYAMGDDNTYDFGENDELIILSGGTLIIGSAFTVKGNGVIIRMHEGSTLKIGNSSAPLQGDACFSVYGSLVSTGTQTSKNKVSVLVSKEIDINGSLTIGDFDEPDVITINGRNDIYSKEIFLSVRAGLDRSGAVSGDLELYVDIPSIYLGSGDSRITIENVSTDIIGKISTNTKNITATINGTAGFGIFGKVDGDDGETVTEGLVSTAINGELLLPEIPKKYSSEYVKELEGTIKIDTTVQTETRGVRGNLFIDDMRIHTQIDLNTDYDSLIKVEASVTAKNIEMESADSDMKTEIDIDDLVIGITVEVSMADDFETFHDIHATVETGCKVSVKKDAAYDGNGLNRYSVDADAIYNSTLTASARMIEDSLYLDTGVDMELKDLKVRMKEGAHNASQVVSAENVALTLKADAPLDDILVDWTDAIEISASLSVDSVDAHISDPGTGEMTDLTLRNFLLTTDNKSSESTEGLDDDPDGEAEDAVQEEGSGGLLSMVMPFVKNLKAEVGSVDYTKTALKKNILKGENILLTAFEPDSFIFSVSAGDLIIGSEDAAGNSSGMEMTSGEMYMSLLGISSSELVSGNFELEGMEFFKLKIHEKATVSSIDSRVLILEVEDGSKVSGNFLLDGMMSSATVGDISIEYEGTEFTDDSIRYEGTPAFLSVEFDNGIGCRMVAGEEFILKEAKEGYVGYDVSTGKTDDNKGKFKTFLDCREYALRYGNCIEIAKAYSEVELDYQVSEEFYGYSDGERTYTPGETFVMKAYDVQLADVFSSVPTYTDGVLDGRGFDVVVVNEDAVAKVKQDGKLTILTWNGTLVYDDAAIENMGNEGFNVQITVMDDISEFPGAVGNGTAYRIDSQYNDFGDGSVTVTVQYELRGQDPDTISVLGIDEFGRTTAVKDVVVGEEAEGMVPVTMRLGHFSDYIVKSVTFEEYGLQGDAGNGDDMTPVIIGVSVAVVLAMIAAAVIIVRRRM